VANFFIFSFTPFHIDVENPAQLTGREKVDISISNVCAIMNIVFENF